MFASQDGSSEDEDCLDEVNAEVACFVLSVCFSLLLVLFFVFCFARIWFWGPIRIVSMAVVCAFRILELTLYRTYGFISFKLNLFPSSWTCSFVVVSGGGDLFLHMIWPHACVRLSTERVQVVPGVGELKAQAIMDHFPTLSSLLSYYRDPSVSTEEKVPCSIPMLFLSLPWLVRQTLERHTDVFQFWSGATATLTKKYIVFYPFSLSRHLFYPVHMDTIQENVLMDKMGDHHFRALSQRIFKVGL